MKGSGQHKLLFAIQGIFYFLTGIWPVLDITSFMVVTGEKTDLWLVRTIGCLLAVSGAIFFLESRSREESHNLIRLAIAQAIVLAGIDVYYVMRSVISPIYLADAVVELTIVGLWFWALKGKQKSNSVSLP